jgi:hypothetical protein
VADLQTLKIQKHAQKQLQFLENLESNGFHFKVGWFASGAKSWARES